MHVSEYILKLASMVGISADDENIKTLLANESLQNVEIADDLATRINSNLLTIESAKNNSELNKHFRATILNGLDAKVTTLISELELPEEIKTEIMGEQSSFERVPLLVKKVKALETEKAKASTGDKNKLQEEIDKLNQQIVNANTEYAKKLAETNSQWEAKFLDNSISTLLSGYNYALPTSKDVNVLTAKTIINNEVNKLGLQVINDAVEGLKLVKLNDDGTQMDYYDSTNQKVGFNDFADKLLTEHKLLKTNNANGVHDNPNPTIPTGGATPPTGGTKMMGAIEQAIAEAQQIS